MLERLLPLLLVLGPVVATNAARGEQPNSGSLNPETHAATGWQQVQRLASNDGIYRDRFGYAVATSGDLVVVGAYADDDDGDRSGSAYIFERHHGGLDQWGQRAKLTASDGDTDDFFGRHVAIHGDIVVIGAPYDEEAGANAGSAYLFERHLGGPDRWGQRKKLTASDAAADALFGSAVAIHGQTVVVGAWGDDAVASNAGAAYVFERELGGPDQWGERAKLVGSELSGTDYFGFAVSVSGDTIAIGALYGDSTLVRTGTVYLYERNIGGPEIWGESTILWANDPGNLDLFGSSVDLDRDLLVVGAYGSDGVGNDSGSAYVFERDLDGPAPWVTRTKIVAGDAASGDLFGWSVSIAGDTIVVGAPKTDEAGPDSGAAYAFKRERGSPDDWIERAKLLGETHAGSLAGVSVGVDRGTIVVGAELGPGVSSGTGAAFLFRDRLFDADFESGDCSAWDTAFANC